MEMEYLFVDTGLLPEEVAGQVRIGDLISFAQPPLELPGDVLAGHSLDNRASVAAVTHCLYELQNRLFALGCLGGGYGPGGRNPGRRA